MKNDETMNGMNRQSVMLHHGNSRRSMHALSILKKMQMNKLVNCYKWCFGMWSHSRMRTIKICWQSCCVLFSLIFFFFFNLNKWVISFSRYAVLLQSYITHWNFQQSVFFFRIWFIQKEMNNESKKFGRVKKQIIWQLTDFKNLK